MNEDDSQQQAPPDSKMKSSSNSINEKETIEVFWSEDFEGSWEFYWDHWDDFTQNGLDYWGTSTVEKYSGLKSVWCAGNGDMVDGGPYDLWMQAYLEPAFSIDASKYANVSLSFRVWSETNPFVFDQLLVNVDYTGTGNNWQHLTAIQGYSFGWELHSIPISSSSSLLVQFYFQSGGDNIFSNDRGVYLDNIELSGTPLPNLTAYQPSGWESEFVLSSVPNTHTSTTLYGNEPTYMDWAIINEGPGDAGICTVTVYFESRSGPIVDQYVVNGLASGDSILREDVLYTFPVGTDSIITHIDWSDDLFIYPAGHVIEWKENDNVWFHIPQWIPGEITFTGYLNYLDPVPPDTNQMPMRNVTVELWDDDFVGDELLDQDVADLNGFFTLGPVNNNDGPFQGRRDIFLRIYSENESAYVTESFNGNVFTIQTPTQNEIVSGSYDTTIIANLLQSGYFGLADILLDAYEAWLLLPGPYAPAVIQAVSADGVSTGWINGQRTMYIDKSISSIDGYPDTWDRDIIYHEYGHVIANDLGFFDASPGGTHSWNQFASLELTAAESWANFLSSVLRTDAVQNNFYNDFKDTFWVNLENGEWGENSSVGGSVNHLGKHLEGAVSGILWDIYDNANDDYDNDGIADTLSLGVDEIIETLNRNISAGHKPDNINDFWEAWFLSPSYGHQRGMMDIWHEHGACCVGMSGDVNWDGTDANIIDMTYLIDFIFRGGPPPPCPLEADLNGDGSSANTLDLTYLIDFIFRGGADPVDCP